MPAGVSADRDLSRFHQQKAQARVAVFADVSSLPLQCAIEDREGGSERAVPRFRQYLHLDNNEKQARLFSASFSAVDSAYCASATSATIRSGS